VKCVDSAFCIDLVKGEPGAVTKSQELTESGERVGIPASALTEFLIGAFHQGGRRLSQAMSLVAQLEVLELTESIAVEAARAGGECSRRGETVGTMDLLVAATAKHHHAHILSRDTDFTRIADVTLETY
jgi:predicted nucleic acid-binding protein